MKNFKQLREDERRDTHYRSEARRAFSLMQKFLKDKIHSFGDIRRTFQIFDDAITIAAPASELGLPKEYSDLAIAFGSLDYPAFGKVQQHSGYSNPFFSFSKTTDGKEIPLIFIPLFRGIKMKIENFQTISSQQEESFIHEFIHYLDFKRFFSSESTFKRKMSPGELHGVDAGSFKSMYDYVNSPHEFNAYYQALADKLEQLVSSNTGLYDWSTFSKFMTTVGFEIPQFFKAYLNITYKRKLVKRLYTFWKEKIDQVKDK